MRNMLILGISLAIAGCGGDSSESEADDSSVAIWDDSSQRIVIVQEYGYVQNLNDRYTTYDYSLDTLTKEAKDALYKIRTTSSPLSCMADGTTYVVTVTDSEGLESEYLSSNMACNDEESTYVSSSDISNFIPLLNN